MDVLRLQKFIANSGYCSRRKAEKLIVSKKVKVNKKIVTQLGTKVSVNDIVEINGKQIYNNILPFKYFLLNKPKNFISTVKDELSRKNILDLIDQKDKKGINLVPVGRLDKNTTGIILLSNDGNFIYKLTHPKFHIEKQYQVKIIGRITEQDIKKLLNGVIIDNNFKAIADEIELLSTSKKYNYSIINITIHNGIKHQVKKMFYNIGYKVIKLNRIRYGFLKLENLRIGEYRSLKLYEINKFKRIFEKKC